jgi:NAD(P)-dependent dehydrogenase (short-subunit alcohol dehydrogenase family)
MILFVLMTNIIEDPLLLSNIKVPETVVITGANGKLGTAITHHLVECGYHIVAIVRPKNGCEQVVNRGDGSVTELALNLVQEKSSTLLCEKLKSLSLSPVGLINNARDLSNLELDENGAVNRTNFQNEHLLGVVVPYEISNALAEIFTSMRSIINISSMYGNVAVNKALYVESGHNSPIHYGVTKAGLNHLTRELAVRFADKGISVNSISFGGVEGRADHKFVEKYNSLCPTGKMLKDENVGHHIKYLLDENLVGLTGHDLKADGGWTIW